MKSLPFHDLMLDEEVVQPAMKSVMHGSLILRQLSQQVAQARNMSVGKRRRKSALLRKIRSKRICKGKKTYRFLIVSETYENERILIKNSKPYIKCVLRLSRVVHGPIYGRFMGRNGFPSPMFADVHISNLGWGKGGNFIYPMMHRFILYYQASERT